MEITILDLINLKKLDGMKLVAGKNGLSRKVKDCGILDYELDSVLRDKYSYSNFHEDQFVLSSFLYAKDNGHLIGDAVKYLVEKRVCALAIKNIYKLPIHDYVLRYADSKDFPIFIIEDGRLYFENIIISVNDCVKSIANMDYGQQEIDSILNRPLNDSAIRHSILQINPSLLSKHIAVYFYLKMPLTINDYDELKDSFKNSCFNTPYASFLRYRNGFLLLYSYDYIDKNEEESLIPEIIRAIAADASKTHIGVSEVHHHIYEVKQSIRESLYSAMLQKGQHSLYMHYGSLGAYQAIFPYAQSNEMRLFSSRIMNPVIDFDAENKSQLAETLIQLIKIGGNLGRLSKELSLHENTLRNRLDRIEQLTGLTYRNPEHYNQLSVAVKIYICSELLDSF